MVHPALILGAAELAKSFDGNASGRRFNQHEMAESLRGFRYLRTPIFSPDRVLVECDYEYRPWLSTSTKTSFSNVDGESL